MLFWNNNEYLLTVFIWMRYLSVEENNCTVLHILPVAPPPASPYPTYAGWHTLTQGLLAPFNSPTLHSPQRPVIYAPGRALGLHSQSPYDLDPCMSRWIPSRVLSCLPTYLFTCLLSPRHYLCVVIIPRHYKVSFSLLYLCLGNI